MGLSIFELGHPTGDGGRIQPDNFEPPDGDWALCLGSDKPGVIVKCDTLDFIEWEQNADFDVTRVFRFRTRVRGPATYPALARVGASTATYGFNITIPGQAPVSITYVADVNGLPIAGQTGATANITAFDGTLVTIDGLTDMSVESIGRQVEVTGAASGGNNGKFTIREFVDEFSVKYENTSGVAPDGNNGAIGWTEKRREDDAPTIERGLVAAVNASSVEATAKSQGDGNLTITPDDLDFDILVDVGLPNATFMKIATAPRWQAIMSIDGTARSTIEIDPRTTRDLIDLGTQVVYLTPGNHDLRFALVFNSLAAAVPSGGPFEVELPGYYVDALVFDEVT